MPTEQKKQFLTAQRDSTVTEPKTVHVVATQHFDILWRRPLAYYRQTQAEVISEVLRILDEHPDFRFGFHQAHALRYFVENHPEQAPALRRRVREGAIEIVGGLETIPDTNMVSGESLVRNIILGRQWVKDYFGVEPKVGSLLDCFGSSGQLPQIFAGTGHQALLAGRMPGARFADSAVSSPFLWRGLDGTITRGIKIAYDAIHQEMIGGWYGWGILEGSDDHLCRNIRAGCGKFIDDICGGLTDLVRNADGCAQVLAVLSGEEHLPRKELVAAVERFNRENDHHTRISTFAEFVNDVDWNKTTDWLEGEYNVEFSGCYTSRIELKQMNQRVETALYNAEFLHALSFLTHHVPPQPNFLLEQWRRLFFSQFHDAICGCHIDENYHHIVQAFDDAINNAQAETASLISGNATNGKCLRVVNTLPFARTEPVRIKTDARVLLDGNGTEMITQRDADELVLVAELSPGGSVDYLIQEPSGPSRPEVGPIAPTSLSQKPIKVGRYLLSENHGQLTIFDSKLNRSVFTDNTMPARLMAREDIGNLWTEEFTGRQWHEPPDRSKLETVTIGAVFAKITYSGRLSADQADWEWFENLTWRKTFYVYKNHDRIDVHIDLDYQGKATELSVHFAAHVDPKKAQCRYDIPFGSILREPYADGEYKFGRGNWPALSWCDYADDHYALTVVHTGTPGCLAKEGHVSFSLLRSAISYERPLFPAPPEPLSYDNGHHHFEFAILPHDPTDPGWLHHARAFTIRPVVVPVEFPLAGNPAGLSVDKPNIILSALKPAQDGQGVVIRLYETLGQPTEVAVKLTAENIKAIETSMDELRDGEPLNLNKITFRPFEVKTIKLTK